VNTRIKKIIKTVREKKTSVRLFVVYALVFVIGFVLVQNVIFGEDAPFQVEIDGERVESNLHFTHPLTGEGVEKEVELPQVFAVMIDDHEGAHPQMGIESAFLAIEAPVEANIPRIEAFFYEGQEGVGDIGPVRSARPYYLDWAGEFDAMYVHVGGSPEALELIVVEDIFDFNQFWNGKFFWRTNDRPAPHNVFTSLESLTEGLELNREKGTAPEKLLYEVWEFKKGDARENIEAGTITINYSPPAYKIRWEFDSERNEYQRFFNGGADTTREGDEVFVDNVAVVVTDVEVIDGEGRRKVRTTGEGEAWVFQDGREIKGTWKKQSRSQRLRFYDADGFEIPMNEGQTWIQVVEDNGDLLIQ